MVTGKDGRGIGVQGLEMIETTPVKGQKMSEIGVDVRLFQDQEVALERKFRVQQVGISKCLKFSQRTQNFVIFGS